MPEDTRSARLRLHQRETALTGSELDAEIADFVRPQGVLDAEARILEEQRAMEMAVIDEAKESYVNRVDAMIAEQRLRAGRVLWTMRVAIDGYAQDVVDGIKCDTAHPEQCLEGGSEVRRMFYVCQGRQPTRDETCAINLAVQRCWEERATPGAHERAAQRDARREEWRPR